ncbi:MAG: hypothetical protein IPJ12_18165 [Betaproteobacteria bacterium]|nr:hypothetical protein [Betaproteobacteria bacterium]
MIIKNAVTLLRAYTSLIRSLPKATEAMFAARSSAGRSIKIFLFGIGVVIPLGSLIWIVLFWHGNGVLRLRVAELPMQKIELLPATGGDV